MNLKRPVVLLGCALLLGVAGPASPTFTYTLNSPNTAVSPYPDPYGSVAVTLDVTKTIATIVFTDSFVFPYQYVFVDGGAAALNVVGSFTVGAVSCTSFFTGGADPSKTACSIAQINVPGGNEDGFGAFDLTIDLFDSYKHAADTITLTLTNLSGWSDEQHVLEQNAGGWFAAAHVAVCDTTLAPCDPSIAAPATGYVGTNGGPRKEVPEPETLALLGVAMIGLGLSRRRQQK